MSHRPLPLLFLLIGLTACAAGETDLDAPPTDGKSDSSGNFVRQPTLHFGQALSASLEQKRHWHEFYAAATEAAPIDVQFAASNDSPEGSVRLVVFGPLKDGARSRVGHAGTSDFETEVALDATLTETGKYVVVVAQHEDDETMAGDYSLAAQCRAGDCGKLDAIASHRFGGLAGLTQDGERRKELTIELNDGVGDAEIDVFQTPLFSPPTHLATVASRDGVAVFEFPDSIVDGDDLSIRVAGIDDGIRLRVWREPRAGIHVPGIHISDFSHRIGVGGVSVFSEGDMWLVLGSEDRGILLTQSFVRSELPGQPGLGFGAFDTTFEISIFDENGELDPVGVELVPSDGEILQIAAVTEEPSIVPVGCFQFCNNLSDDQGCTDITPVDCTDGALPLPTL